MSSIAHPEVDATDPLVVLISWSLTFATAKLTKDTKKLAAIRHFLPLVSLAAAVAARAAIDTLQGHELTGDTLARALASGAVAVMSHSQVREAMKATRPVTPEPEPEVFPEEADPFTSVTASVLNEFVEDPPEKVDKEA